MPQALTCVDYSSKSTSSGVAYDVTLNANALWPLVAAC